jgi:hypothetical protein
MLFGKIETRVHSPLGRYESLHAELAKVEGWDTLYTNQMEDKRASAGPGYTKTGDEPDGSADHIDQRPCR